MKMSKETIEDVRKGAIAEQEKAKVTFERQQGVLNFCDWILKNCELSSDIEKDIENK